MFRRWISAPVQATAGPTRTSSGAGSGHMLRCSRGPDGLRLVAKSRIAHIGYGGAGPVAGGSRGVLFNDLAPRCCIQQSEGEGVKLTLTSHGDGPRREHATALPRDLARRRHGVQFHMRVAVASAPTLTRGTENGRRRAGKQTHRSGHHGMRAAIRPAPCHLQEPTIRGQRVVKRLCSPSSSRLPPRLRMVARMQAPGRSRQASACRRG